MESDAGAHAHGAKGSFLTIGPPTAENHRRTCLRLSTFEVGDGPMGDDLEDLARRVRSKLGLSFQALGFGLVALVMLWPVVAVVLGIVVFFTGSYMVAQVIGSFCEVLAAVIAIALILAAFLLPLLIIAFLETPPHSFPFLPLVQWLLTWLAGA
jgi:hypothetical protein